MGYRAYEDMRASRDMYIQRVAGISKDRSGHVRIYKYILIM